MTQKAKVTGIRTVKNSDCNTLMLTRPLELTIIIFYYYFFCVETRACIGAQAFAAAQCSALLAPKDRDDFQQQIFIFCAITPTKN